MYALMCYEMALLNEWLITHITSIRTLTAVYALMCYQIALFTECLITHITSIRALTTMYKLMPYHIALFTECLITQGTQICMPSHTYITGMCAFSTVIMWLFIHSTLVKNG
jgi:hypothetical protein